MKSAEWPPPLSRCPLAGQASPRLRGTAAFLTTIDTAATADRGDQPLLGVAEMAAPFPAVGPGVPVSAPVLLEFAAPVTPILAVCAALCQLGRHLPIIHLCREAQPPRLSLPSLSWIRPLSNSLLLGDRPPESHCWCRVDVRAFPSDLAATSPRCIPGPRGRGRIPMTKAAGVKFSAG